ncbi:MAG: BlaI/MecI/CopY family transcriptional regulator [Planctomycetota bacterium]
MTDRQATGRQPDQPTERELDALKVLWQAVDAGADGATVREIAAVLEEDGEQLAYTTVLSLLQVMEQKGLVDHFRQGKAYVYRPLIERQSTFRNLAGGFLDRVFDGAVSEYLVHAIGDRPLSADELDRLESMIAAAREQQDPKGKKSKRGGKPRRARKQGDE